MEKSPIRTTDDDARALARRLRDEARIAALAVLDPATGAPQVTRIGIGQTPLGLTGLISSLSAHHSALKADPRCSLLLGEPPNKGDPLAFPRLSLGAKAVFIPSSHPDRPAIRAAWLDQHPKAALYVDFADFSFVQFQPMGAALNGGFGKAYTLTAEDLA